MRSSIFASNGTPICHLKILAAFCVLFLIGVEILFSHPIEKRSVTYRRVSHQYVEALGSRPSKSGDPVSVLMVGNSLLLYGVDLPLLHASTASRLRIYPIFLEFSAYYDWLYGLQRLFRLGARPQLVVVGLGPDSLIEDSVRTDYSPMLLFDASDIIHVSADLGLDRTATADLLLAHWSTFWDMRRPFRVQFLLRMIPYAEDLFTFVRPRRSVPFGAESEAKTVRRLQSLRLLVEGYGSQLLLLIPPTPASESRVRQTMLAAKKVGVEVFVPIDPMTLSLGWYQPDAVHLNAEGQSRFTSALAADLPRRITTRDRASTPD
jgi:hypothetical protein